MKTANISGKVALFKALNAALVGVTCLVSAASASAADPVVAGTTNSGTHPTYGPTDSGFWRTGKGYSLLTDGTNTFLNAPSSSGGLYLRNGNSPLLDLDAHGANLAPARFINPYVAFGTSSTGTWDAVARIGNHPWYGTGYAAFWFDAPNCTNCGGPWDYALLADSEDTFLNAPRGDRGTLHFRAGNVELMSVSPQGGFAVQGLASKPGGGSWAALSDARVKADVTDFRDGLTELEKIRPVSFRYNGLGGMADTKTRFVGVIAQELERTLPFMVSTMVKKLHPEDKTETELKEVDPSAFTYVLINAVKQLSAENRSMKKVLCQDHPHESFCTKRTDE